MRWTWCVFICIFGCGSFTDSDDESGDNTALPRLVDRASQPKFKPDDFTFTQVMSKSDDGKGGLFGTCLHVPMHDQNRWTADCPIGVILPIHIYDEKWPRDTGEAARMTAKAANSARTHLASFKHADAFTCGAYRNEMQAYLGQPKPKRKALWKGARVFRCDTYKHRTLPDFYFKRGTLLIGNYRKWTMRKRQK